MLIYVYDCHLKEYPMNKGRLFVVNEQTIKDTINNMEVSIYTPKPTGKQWLKTIADIMADLLQTEIGDYVFLWETKTANKKNQIHGVYRIISKPYYQLSSLSDEYPFKIKIEPAYIFNTALDEYDVLNCPFAHNPLWTIIGKKVAGKSRGTSPLSQDEVRLLITLLIGKNPDFHFVPFDKSRIVDNVSSFEIDYSKVGSNKSVSSLNDIVPSNLCFFDKSHNVQYEKILETLFNQEMSKRNKVFFNQIGVNVDNVVWFSNYLPYSIEQSEMDYVIFESLDNIATSKVFLIEFMKTAVDNSHIYRSLLYSKWINDSLSLGEPITQPIIICYDSYDFINGEKNTRKLNAMRRMKKYIDDCNNEFKTKELQIFTYDFSKAKPLFTRKL